MGAPVDLVVSAARAIVDGTERPATVVVDGGLVAAVLPHAAAAAPAAREHVVLAADEVLVPGLVDTHVHVNEPGRTPWEGFATATRAAALGGVTTIVDMPLNSVPPTVDPGALRLKREAAQGQAAVDVGFWGGAVPESLGRLAPLHEAGVFGFKAFLVDSGVPEFPPLDGAQLADALAEVAALGSVLLVHAEDPAVLGAAPPAAGRRFADFLASRPAAAEAAAVEHLLDAVREAAARGPAPRVHVLHVAGADALPLVAAAKADGLPVSAETCPHYLGLQAEDVPDGATQYKCCPPIREGAHRERLWAALADGTLDIVVTDHSPCTPDLKRMDTGDFGAAWGGIASLQLGLAVTWTAARARGLALADVTGWMSTAPARLFGLAGKGRIAPGYAADLAVVAPDDTFVVDPARLAHRNPVTPYVGRELAGAVRRTWLAGVDVTGGGPPAGRLLSRTPEGAAPVRGAA